MSERAVNKRVIGQSLAAASVALSLLFVGYEIRQNTAVARGQTRQELAALNQEWLVLHSTDYEFSDLYTRVWVLEEEVSDDDLRHANWAMRLNLRRLENVYFQYSEGLVDESALNSYGLQATRVFRTSRFRDFWQSSRGAYDPDFVEFFEERMGLE